jgi:glyoxylase-like metal-dependent hydrolase (beta-lactamase superfamily II)
MTFPRFFVLAALAACSGASKAPAPTPPAEPAAARIHRFEIGALAAVALEDGTITVPNDGNTLALGHADEAGALLAAAGLPRDQLHLSIQPLLVEDGDRVLLFDTGAGNAAFAKAGRLVAALAAAGHAPADVTDIFISHAHGDHIGGLVNAAGAPVFASATIHVSAPEWAAWKVAPEDAALVAAIAGQVAPFEPGAQLLPEVRAVATQGHTPGHSSYDISSGDEHLFYLGDVAHHSIISVQQPAWSIQFDMDRPAAEAMRQATLTSLATGHTRVYAVHFPFPGLGHVAGEGGALIWQPE